MNKQNLWFISLFSIILVLCIYYITIPQNILDEYEQSQLVTEKLVNKEEISSLIALKVSKDEEVLNEINELQKVIVDNTKTTEEKNMAYEELKLINYNKALEEQIEKIIKDEFKYDSYIKINNDEISIVISSDNHSKEIANNIINRIQKEFKEKKYITIKFQK